MIDPKRPETDPAETPPGERAYEDLPVRGTAQGPRSLGASEPGDIGAPRNDEAKRTAEHGGTDAPGVTPGEAAARREASEDADAARAEKRPRA